MMTHYQLWDWSNEHGNRMLTLLLITVDETEMIGSNSSLEPPNFHPYNPAISLCQIGIFRFYCCWQRTLAENIGTEHSRVLKGTIHDPDKP
jgi:hypothetical protein